MAWNIIWNVHKLLRQTLILDAKFIQFPDLKKKNQPTSLRQCQILYKLVDFLADDCEGLQISKVVEFTCRQYTDN